MAANPDFVGNLVGLESTGRLHHRFTHEKTLWGDSLSALYLGKAASSAS